MAPRRPGMASWLPYLALWTAFRRQEKVIEQDLMEKFQVIKRWCLFEIFQVRQRHHHLRAG
jgi:hypothetical protein